MLRVFGFCRVMRRETDIRCRLNFISFLEFMSLLEWLKIVA